MVRIRKYEDKTTYYHKQQDKKNSTELSEDNQLGSAYHGPIAPAPDLTSRSTIT